MTVNKIIIFIYKNVIEFINKLQLKFFLSRKNFIYK